MERFKTVEEWYQDFAHSDDSLDVLLEKVQDDVLEFLAQNAKLVYEVDGIAGSCKISIDKDFIRGLKNNKE